VVAAVRSNRSFAEDALKIEVVAAVEAFLEKLSKN